jgi:hypothetical protein
VFVPIKLFDFSDPRVILKYRRILEYFALTAKVQEELAAANEDRWRQGHTVTLVEGNGRELYVIPGTDPKLTKIDYELSGNGIVDGIQLMFNNGTHWSSGSWGLGGDGQGVRTGAVFENTSVKMSDIAKVLYDPDNNHIGDILKLTYHFEGSSGSSTFEQTITLTGDSYGYEAARVQVSKHDATEIIQHMQEHAMYYSRAIWLYMDETDWMKALLTVTYKGQPVATTIEPKPIALLGNYIAFPWHFKDEGEKLDWLLETKLLDRDFTEWMSRKGHQAISVAVKEEYLDAHDEPQGDAGAESTDVPMATGGVFAEAVLGRSNCAEKIDLTRFWDWKDSPIQIMPPEIHKLTAGSRDPSQWLAALKSSGLDEQAIHLYMPNQQAEIDAAAATADGTMASLYQSVAMSNMFRDMSNAAATTALAQQSTDAAAAGATDAGQQETKNIQAVAEVAAAAGKAAMTAAFPEGELAGGVTSAGGLLNMAGKLDESDTTGGAAEGEGEAASKDAETGSAGNEHQVEALKGMMSRFL